VELAAPDHRVLTHRNQERDDDSVHQKPPARFT
jgi:hypothetical protein